MIKTILSVFSILFFAAAAQAQNISFHEDHLKIRQVATEADEIFLLILNNDSSKVADHLEKFPECVTLTYENWTPLHWAVHKRDKVATKAIILSLKAHDQMNLVYQRGDEYGDQSAVSSPYDLGPEFVDLIISQLDPRD
jgi:hypothetical protein